MELTIKISREECKDLLTALVNAELDAWDHARKTSDEETKLRRRKDEETIFSLRNRIEQAFDNVAPWVNERRCGR